MFSIRLLSLVIFSAAVSTQANGMLRSLGKISRAKSSVRHNLPRFSSQKISFEDARILKAHIACEYLTKHRPCLVSLLRDSREFDINPNHIVATSGMTPLMKAGEMGDIDVVHNLMKSGDYDINAQDQAGNNVLNYTLEGLCFYRAHPEAHPIENWIEIFTLFINAGVDVNNQSGARKFTPLMYASLYGSEEIVELLLNDDNVNAFGKNENGYSAFDIVIKNENKEIISLFLCHKDITCELINKALISCNNEEIKDMLFECGLELLTEEFFKVSIDPSKE